MKLTGSVFIVLSFFLIGYTKRKKQLELQRIYEQLTAFVRLVKNDVQYTSSTTPQILEKAAACGDYLLLSFIDAALERVEKGGEFTKELCGAFEEFALRVRLTVNSREALADLFASSAEINSQELNEKCAVCDELLREALESTKAENAQKKGVYETVYTLLGAAVCIALV